MGIKNIEGNFFEKIFGLKKNQDIPKEPQRSDLAYAKKSTFEANRSLDELEKILNFNREELRGKVILDLGASKHAQLDNDLQKNNIDAVVISLSPAYTEEQKRKELKEKNPKRIYIAALGDELPFKEESFDVVISSHVLEHLPSRTVFLTIISEIIRVLKKGGSAYIGETFPEAKDEMGTKYSSYSMELAANDIGLKPEQIEITTEETPNRERYRDLNTGHTIGWVNTGRIIIKKL